MDEWEAMMTSPTGQRHGVESRKRGFTLIELILVMAMLAAVMAMTAPSLSKFFRGRSIDSETRRLLAATRYGQSRAVSEGMPVILWIDPQNRRYGVRLDSGFQDQDPRAVEYEWANELTIEVVADNARRSIREGMDVIEFLPDAALSENSPESLRIEDKKDNTEMWLVRSLNRLNYEVATNSQQIIRRQ